MLKLGNIFNNRSKTPSFIQMEATECGSTALMIILAYYGRYITYQKARSACGISRDGSKASNIVAAARSFGMEAQGMQVEDSETLEEIGFPLIAFWGFNHFIVVEGFTKNKSGVYVNDPATGPRVIPYEEFNKLFTGIVLSIKPGENFSKDGRPASIISFLLDRTTGSWNTLIYVIILSILLIFPRLVIPGFSKIFLDDIFIGHIDNWFSPFVLALVSVTIIQISLMWIQRVYLVKLQIKFLFTSVANFFWHMIHLPIEFFKQRGTGDIIERMTANDRVAAILSSDLSFSMVNMLSMVIFGGLLFLLSVPLALVGISMTLINLVILIMVSQLIATNSYKVLQQQAELSSVEMNGLNCIETLKVTSAEDSFFKKWSALHATSISSQQQLAYISSLLMILPTFISSITGILVLWIGSIQIINGDLTIGTLIAFQALIVAFQEPLEMLLGVGEKIQRMKADAARITDVMNNPLDPLSSSDRPIFDQDNPNLQGNLEGNVNFKNVTFGYLALEKPLLSDVSLSITAKQRVAVIGPNGSGKSTLAKLITGLHQPWSGQIMIDDQNLLDHNPDTLSKSIGYVDQDIYLFEGSVRDNLTLWNNDISEEQLEQVLKDSCIYEDIIERGGLDCNIEEGGKNFSRGQCQRLEIARSLVHNPTMVIFDESTSALDYENENRIYDNLKKRNCTLISISHRLDRIQNFDKIIVLYQGKIVQEGTHKTLSQEEGIYKKLAEYEQKDAW